MEAFQLHDPYLGPLSDQKAHSPLRAAVICGERWRTHHVIAQTVLKIRLAGNLVLGHYHDAEAAELDHPHVLTEAKALDIADVVGTKG